MAGDCVVELVGTWDEQADAAYLSLVPGPERPQVAATLEVLDREGSTLAVFDVSEDGALIGLEVLGASALLTPALRRRLSNP